jgi:hypothetical protein
MIKNFIIILTLLVSVKISAQSNYSNGFQNGYKEGYCYNDFGCIPPIPPITPIPLIGENTNNYQDGYNRGFKKGLEDKEIKKQNSQNNQSAQNNNRQSQVYTSSYSSSDNYNVLLRAMEMKQAQMEMYQAQNDRNKQIKQEKTFGVINQVKSYYTSLSKYPDTISNGWHKVISTNNYDFCEERKVYVENNKVTKYVVDDWNSRPISYSLTINKAKTIMQLLSDDGEKGETLELYFLDDINNPNSYVTPPVGSGKISFWTSWKNSGNLILYFDGDYVGKFTSYFSEGNPICGQKGTLTVTYKPGTYNFKAVSEGEWSTRTWEGTVTIYENGCQLQGLTKK